ncbi:MAG: hydroxymethylbilane synthase [Candidatus Magnetoovum sp. WYHC-5]|nr:hydroxymethylbilane synthase [Candidatus Magnetoovum sp. WYHC-5]
MKTLTIGTRGSKLALWQANWVRNELIKCYPGLNVGLNIIKTTGDKITDVALSKIGGKGLFVKEIEEALLSNQCDLAVHSMKDVPVVFPEGLSLCAICKREDAHDALVLNSKIKADSIESLPQGIKIGTSSLRRQCQLINKRPDFKVETLRGNLDTRLKKAKEGSYDAVILAVAGLKRLGLEESISAIIGYDTMLPAVGQGAIGIETRTNDDYVNGIVSSLNDMQSFTCVAAERGFLERLEGGCQVPIGAYAFMDGDGLLMIEGLVGTVTGSRIIRRQKIGNPQNPQISGKELAEEILQEGAGAILDEFYKKG